MPQPPVAGGIATVAGGVGGPAQATQVSLGTRLTGPCGVTFGAGSLYVADIGAVHEVSLATDALTTPAGTQAAGPLGDGGPASSAALRTCGAAVDSLGNLVIADRVDNRIRVVAVSDGTFYGQAMTAGDIYTVAGDGTAGFSGDGGPAIAANLSGPASVAVDIFGDLLIAVPKSNRVRMVPVASGTFFGRAMTSHDIYTVAGDNTRGFSGDGVPANHAELNRPSGVAADGFGNLVIADTDNNRIRVVAMRRGTFYGQAMFAGRITTVAGNGIAGLSGDTGPATGAEVNLPTGVAVDEPGNLVIADSHNARVRVMPATTGTFYGQAMTAGDIYTVAGDGNAGFAGDGGPASGAELNFPFGVATNVSGDVFVADLENHRIREVAP